MMFYFSTFYFINYLLNFKHCHTQLYQRNELFKERHLPGLSVTIHHMAPSSGLSVTGKAKHG